MKNFKERWNIDSNLQLTVIIIVFAITGSSSVKLSTPLIEFIGLSTETTNWLVYWTLNVLITFGLYQVLLITFGTLFGQFKFFWSFEKKMLSRFGINLGDNEQHSFNEVRTTEDEPINEIQITLPKNKPTKIEPQNCSINAGRIDSKDIEISIEGGVLPYPTEVGNQ